MGLYSGERVAYELASGHAGLEVGDMKISVEKEDGVRDGVDNA